MVDGVPQENSNGDDTVDKAAEAVEPVVPPEVVNNDDTKGPIVFQSIRSIEELINNGPADSNIEE